MGVKASIPGQWQAAEVEEPVGRVQTGPVVKAVTAEQRNLLLYQGLLFITPVAVAQEQAEDQEDWEAVLQQHHKKVVAQTAQLLRQRLQMLQLTLVGVGLEEEAVELTAAVVLRAVQVLLLFVMQIHFQQLQALLVAQQLQ